MSFSRPLNHVEVAALLAQNCEVPTDWAESLTQINKAVRVMEEALPGQNEAAVIAAMETLESSTQKLREFLTFRGIFAEKVTFG